MRARFLSAVERLASLRLTVVLLVLGMVLVTVATLVQSKLGIWEIQQRFFQSFIVFVPLSGTDISVPIFPGGYLVGGVLLVNLLCAQFLRFRLTWRNCGLHLTHFGLILLLIGELVTGIYSENSQMVLDTGATRNYVESTNDSELAIVDTTDPGFDQVWAVPTERLAKRTPIALPGGELIVQAIEFHKNAQLFWRDQAPNAPASAATFGLGQRLVLQPAPVAHGENADNWQTAVVELRAPDGVVGTALVSMQIGEAQSFTHGGRTYTIALRRARTYFDFALTLIQFRHDKYPGTNIPRNFSSEVRLRSAGGAENREVRIFMNNPLRYGGYTFYQQSFANNDRTSILQVVRNPGRHIPYIACILSSLGLTIHFLITLAGFLSRRRTNA